MSLERTNFKVNSTTVGNINPLAQAELALGSNTQALGEEKNKDRFESNNSLNLSNDGKFSFSEALKDFGKGLISPITALGEMFTSTTGFLFGAVMIGGGIALAAFLPVTIPIMLVAGGAFSLFELGKGALKFITSAVNSDGDGMEQAFKDIGAGTIGTVLTLLGIKGTAVIAAEAKAAGAAIRAGLTEAEAVQEGLQAAEAAKSMTLTEAFKTDLSLFSRDGIAAMKNSRRLANIKKSLLNNERLFLQIPGVRKDRSWASTMEETIRDASKNIDNFQSADDLITFISNSYRNYYKNHLSKLRNRVLNKSRQLLGRPSSALSWERYGKFRDKNYFGAPAVTGSYAGYKPPATNLVQSGLNNESTIIEVVNGNKVLKHTMRGKIGEEVLDLTSTTIAENGEVRWWHPDPENIPKIFKHINNLYREISVIRNEINTGNIQKNKESLDRLVKLTSEIHWWFAQGCPFERGSAGIADVFKNVIFDSVGIRTPKWAIGKAPDLEALVRPLDDYLEMYPRLFENEICWH